jgi:flagellar basal-body rod modification protein FlgD
MLINGIHATTVPGNGTGTSATGATGSTGTGSTSTTPAASSTSLGGTDFLTLMLAQLKNQDPTSPVDSNTFLTQLAQLSEVQGITTLNTTFTNSLSSSQALQASSLLGHQALVNSTSATLAASGAAVNGAVNVPQTTSQVVLNITDSNGALVRQINLGAQSSGLANFTWDGKESNGSQAPAGQYTLSAQYAGAVSGGTAATTLVTGTVESVSMGAGSAGLTLNVAGIGSVPFSSVQQISN